MGRHENLVQFRRLSAILGQIIQRCQHRAQCHESIALLLPHTLPAHRQEVVHLREEEIKDGTCRIEQKEFSALETIKVFKESIKVGLYVEPERIQT